MKNILKNHSVEKRTATTSIQKLFKSLIRGDIANE